MRSVVCSSSKLVTDKCFLMECIDAGHDYFELGLRINLTSLFMRLLRWTLQITFIQHKLLHLSTGL